MKRESSGALRSKGVCRLVTALSAVVIVGVAPVGIAPTARAVGWYHGFTDPHLWVNGRQRLSGNMAGACQFGHDVWNRAGTPARVDWNDTTPRLTLAAADLPGTVMGLFTSLLVDSNGHAVTAKIQIDTAAANQYLPGKWSAKIQGVYAHELGHALNLADNPSTTSLSLMKFGTQGLAGGHYSPQAYDIQDVKWIYK